MNIPITQSELWQNLQNDLKELCFFKKTSDYQYLAIQKHTPVGDYFYLPYGPVAGNQAGFNHALKDLEKLAREHRAIFIRIEPTNPTFKLPKSAQKSKDQNPADTWVLDLTPDQATLLTNFSQGARTRYNTYEKKGITVRSTRDLSEIQHLVSLQSQLFQKKHISAYAEDYLKTELKQPFATLYLAEYHLKHDQTTHKEPASAQGAASLGASATAKTARSASVEHVTPVSSASSHSHTGSANSPSPRPRDGQVLAASLFFDYAGTRYYMQSAADLEFKKLPATVALLTTAIFDAKAAGLKTFDFWGIAPDGAPADHPWRGFTEFKKSFGGTPVKYRGTYDLPFNSFKYQLYRALRTVYHHLR